MNSNLILKNISKHVHLHKAEEEYFISLLQPKTIKRKAFLLQAEEICKYETFITKGCLRLYTTGVDGVEHIVLFAVEDWWAGDLYSFLTQTPATFTIDALEDTEVLQLSKPNLEQLYERVPKFERFFRLIIQNAFIAQQQRVMQSLSLTAEERYLHFIQKYPQLEQRLPQKQVAAYIGITPEFLSMLRRKLVRA